MDSGSGTWTILQGFSPYSTNLQVTVTTPTINIGSTYLFRYRALNRQGWGPYSDSTAVLAAQVPDQIAPIVTTMNGEKVKITWNVPSTGGASLTKYKIMIETSTTGTFAEQLYYCDGSNFVVLANAFCEIPMYILTQASGPY